jgi:hypothetical protein
MAPALAKVRSDRYNIVLKKFRAAARRRRRE